MKKIIEISDILHEINCYCHSTTFEDKIPTKPTTVLRLAKYRLIKRLLSRQLSFITEKSVRDIREVLANYPDGIPRSRKKHAMPSIIIRNCKNNYIPREDNWDKPLISNNKIKDLYKDQTYD